jgi:hypothetical protein
MYDLLDSPEGFFLAFALTGRIVVNWAE